jgi:copper chaperone
MGVYCAKIPTTEEPQISQTITYTVAQIHCAHCAASIKEEVSEVAGVQAVDVDIDSKVVTVSGDALSDDSLRTAIREAGYEAA